MTSPPEPRYNCIAWAAGVSDSWWRPDAAGFEYWPTGAPRVESLDAFQQAFATLGYLPCSDSALESGWGKVAIYAFNGAPTHAARQLASGRWTSKLGPEDDIEHELDGLAGPAYGFVAMVLKRPTATAP